MRKSRSIRAVDEGDELEVIWYKGGTLLYLRTPEDGLCLDDRGVGELYKCASSVRLGPRLGSGIEHPGAMHCNTGEIEGCA